MLAIIGLTLLVSAVAGQMHPAPPPPYTMYGPPYMPQPPMMAPPPPMSPYPASTSVSYSTYPLLAPMQPMQPAAAAPYPSYGMPQPPPPSQPIMYPPPYQTFSGSGPMGDPFTTTTGICKYTGSRYQSPVAPLFNGMYKKANFGMICSRYS